MHEFLKLVPPGQALAELLERVPEGPQAIENKETLSAVGRTTAEMIVSPDYSPAFTRSTVDGFAVQAGDTHGASERQPVYLELAGEVSMGKQPDFELKPGQAALIYTGGMLPAGANAVEMTEFSEESLSGEIEVQRPVAYGENVIQKGEDVTPGQEILAKGVKLGASEIGGLLTFGLTKVLVASEPRVGIISSGDEVVEPSATPIYGQVRDINSHSLAVLVEQSGGRAVKLGIAPDEKRILEKLAQKAVTENDMLIITAGSSASQRDLTAEVIQGLGEPGILVHGINFKPGKPTILAMCGSKPVIGLPGNPVSALVVAGLFVKPVIEKLLGRTSRGFRASLTARLISNVPSQAGREDWVPVILIPTGTGWNAQPIFFKSNLIFTLSRADGLIRITAEQTGLNAGELAQVYLKD